MNLCPQLRRLAAEHVRWLADLASWASAGEQKRRTRLLALWRTEVLPHCRAEEDVLLPELAKRLSDADAAIVFTLSDHVALRRLARELREASRARRGAALAALERKLSEHTEFEKRTLFPALQETLGCERVAALEPELTLDRQDPRHRPAGHSAGCNRSIRQKER